MSFDDDPQVDRAFDDLFSMRTLPQADYEELLKLARLGRVISEAPSIVPDEIGGNVRIEFTKHDKTPVIVVDSVLYPNRRYQGADITETFEQAKAAKR